MELTGPYQLVCRFQNGLERVIEAGHNPSVVRNAHNRISRNPAMVARIELRDLTGPLETIWSASWPVSN